MTQAIALVRRLIDVVFPRGVLILSILTFGSYLMGLVRDRILTQRFGAGAELDAFNAAFVLPDLTFSVIVASGLAAPFIPIFVDLRQRDNRAAIEFGQTILTLAVLAMATSAAVLAIAAPLTVEIVAPGFTEEQRATYIDLFRVMAFTQILFAASTALGEVLVAERRFLFYGLAPLMFNTGIIIGTLALGDRLGVAAPAVGAVLGAALHLAVRIAGTLRTDFRIRPRLAIRTPALGEFFRLAIPKAGSGPIEPLTFFFFTRVASTLASGSITTINLARNFQSVPVSLIGIAFAVAAFPGLAASYARGDQAGFVRLVRLNALRVGALTGAAAIGLVIVGEFAIDVLLGGGRFDADAVSRTADVLAIFAIAVPFESLGHLLSRAIYATHHTTSQVLATIAGFAITLIVTQGLVGTIGVVAVPLGFSAGSAVRCALLVIVLRRRIGRMTTY